jgi:hypothetical protein
MSSVTALMMDVVTEKSNHQFPPMGVSVCLTPAAPAPLPIPYPVFGMSNEGLEDVPMRTKVNGVACLTVGAVAKQCHGNEAGTLKEVVSLNTCGPIFPIMGAPTVICELGMMAITLSPGFENRAMGPGMGGNASAASGTGDPASASNQDGSKDGDDKKADEAQNNAGADGSDDGSGASAAPATPVKQQDKYCPHEHPGKATPGHLADIEKNDLRNYKDELINETDPIAKREARKAIYGKPGGHSGSKKQAFWSGGGKDAAVHSHQKSHHAPDGYTIQEDSGGAAMLEKGNKDLKKESAPGAKDGWTMDQGTQGVVTNEKLWKTISRRSAENADGEVDAFVVGHARPDNVFASTELPTLLHNPKLNKIRFRNPSHKPPPAPVVSEWTKGPDGCWTGDEVPGADGGRGHNPGFKLDRDKGFTR